MPKVILVSGATSGIGKVCAEMLAQKGYRVYATGRRVDPAGEKKGAYQLVQCDVTDHKSVEECIARIIGEAGRIEVLVNCAGFGLGGAVEETTVEEAKMQFETNFFGTHRMCREVMPVMRNQGGGMIITVSSVAAEFTIPYQSFYSSSKMALDGLTQAIRMEGKPFGIIAACVNPGDVKTGFTAARHQAAACQPGSPYYRLTMKSIETMKKDEMNGMDPQRVAQMVCRLVEKKRLKPKYFIESQYKLVMVLKRILPTQTVETLLRKMYAE
ncbi:MAG: SDR family oxidoreductase [Chitinophagales bacterium]